MTTTTVLPAASLRALLAASLDYAGLFPPAGLTLESALNCHATDLRGENAWMLSRFVLPVGKFDEASPLLPKRFGAGRPLHVSALVPRSDSAAEFFERLRAGAAAIAGLHALHGGIVRVDQMEASLPPDLAAPALHALFRKCADLLGEMLPGGLTLFWELPWTEDPAPDASAPLDALARHNAVSHGGSGLTSSGTTMGAKLRTGGLVPAAFPGSEPLARALTGARDAGSVPLKFTAGLHHPVRHFSAEVGTKMHGFLNVFVAGCLAREHSLDAAEIESILDDERPESFRFDAGELRWRDRRLPTERIGEHRASFVTTFGSCSFAEPCADLRALGLLF